MKRFALAATAALAFVLPSAANAAVQVNITSISNPQGTRSGALDYNPSPYDNQTISIGEFKFAGNYVVGGAPASFLTYCLDLFHGTANGVYDIVSLSTAYTGVRATNINKILANTNAIDTDTSAAIQMALWEVAYETSSSFNVNSGVFNITGGSSSAARTLANTYLSNLGTWNVSSNQTAQLLVSQGKQTQVFLAPVPEATTWAMMIVGMGVVGSSVRRRRRTAVYAVA